MAWFSPTPGHKLEETRDPSEPQGLYEGEEGGEAGEGFGSVS